MLMDLEWLDSNGNVDYDVLIAELEEEIRMKNKIWTTREGKEIKIKDMETGHILNTIRMIVRNSDMSDIGKKYIEMFVNELKSRIKK